MPELLSAVSADSLRQTLTAFWQEQLCIERHRDRFVLALPLMDAEGWQIVVSLQPVSATRAILTDRGATLARLENLGLDLNAESVSRQLVERLQTFELVRDGFELKREIAVPVQGVDVQIFGEALVSIAHLLYRHEPAQRRSDHVYHHVRGLLQRQQLRFVEGVRAVVVGRTEKQIPVDFLVSERRMVACKTIERRGRMRDYMEQWGYRWLDAKKHDERLVTAMFYDPDNQQWDDSSLSIGRDVCDIFRPYHEVAAIENDLVRYAQAV
jgi:sporulation protein YlmC with PRC-barrel domain